MDALSRPEDVYATAQQDADSLAHVLCSTLPQATLDQLTVRLLQRAASCLRVRKEL
jgi:hypothetical protein